MIVKSGDLFRQFRVLEKIGEGGMGVVYRAHDTRLDREVALKFLTHMGPPDAEPVARFRREGRSLAALNHPNVVAIHDIDEAEGIPYLVLEWVPGRSLNDPAFRRQLPVEEFLPIASSIAEGLAAAHMRGIVHRDVKPGNVLVTGDGRIKLVDFGLAKVRDAGEDVTRTAYTVGTVAYMSPEQATGNEVGPPSDVFSFGILAYELLTGRRPFEGDALGSVLSAIVRDPHVPLWSRRKDLPAGLVDVIEMCLSKEPADRFQNGSELARALAGLEAGRQSPGSGDATGVDTMRISSRSAIQDIRFCTTTDGARIAYSVIGTGPVLVRVLGWFTHLEMEWEWPHLRLFWESLAERHTLVRYDGRGIGLSDPYAGEFNEETRLLDLDAVLTAVGAKSANLLGVSEGGWTAVIYAIGHPDRVAHLVLYGAYCRGARARPGYDPEEEEALVTLMRKGWGRDTPTFRQIFTSQFFRSDADPNVIAHFNEMQRASADPDTAARYMASNHNRGDGRDLFARVGTPTLVVHCRDDKAVSPEEGRLLAAVIPSARLLLIPSGSHYFPTDREVVTRVVGAITDFVAGAEPA